MTNQLFRQALIISFLFCISSQLFKVSAEEFDIEYRDFNCSPKLQSVVLIDSENDTIYTCEDIVSLFPILSDESNYDKIISDTSGNFILIQDWSKEDQTTVSKLVQIKNSQPITNWTHIFSKDYQSSWLSSKGTVFNIYNAKFDITDKVDEYYFEIILADGNRVDLEGFEGYLPIKSPLHYEHDKYHQWTFSGDLFFLYVSQYDYLNEINYGSFIVFGEDGRIHDVYTYDGILKYFRISSSSQHLLIKMKLNNVVNSFIVDRFNKKSISIDNNISVISDVCNGYIFYGYDDEIVQQSFDNNALPNEIFDLMDSNIVRLQCYDEMLISFSTRYNFDQHLNSYSFLINRIDFKTGINKFISFFEDHYSGHIINDVILSTRLKKIIVVFNFRMAIFDF